jgi:hypothetical protein
MGSDKSAKKEKKAKSRESTGGDGDDVPVVRAEYLAPIAKPLADDKLSKKVRYCTVLNTLVGLVAVRVVVHDGMACIT